MLLCPEGPLDRFGDHFGFHFGAISGIWSSFSMFFKDFPAKNPRVQDQFMLLCPEGRLDRFVNTLGFMLELF